MNAQIQVLKRSIIDANESYWDAATNPLMTDLEYDKLKLKYLALVPEDTHDEIVDENYRSVILSNIKKRVKHDKPLLSLMKANTVEDVNSWMMKVSRSNEEAFRIQGKFDGIACKMYRGLTKLVTRGSSSSDVESGSYGYDISHILPIVDFINIDPVRNQIGELVVSNNTFRKFKPLIKTSNGTEFVNARAMAAGITNRIDIQDLILNEFKLTFIVYDTPKRAESNFGFDIVSNNGDLLPIIDSIKYESDYPLDGVVIRLNDDEYAKSLGVNLKFPKHSIAYKFPDELKTTVIESIELQHGRGKITPVANVTPVEVAGVVITRASLHNWSKVLKLDVRAGDTVSIIRSKDTIPHIVDKVESAQGETSLVHLWCEYCKLPLIYKEPELYCPNKSKCVGSFYTQIENSLKVIGFDNIGEKTIAFIVDTYGVTDIVDVLTLTDAQIENIPRYNVSKFNVEVKKLKQIGITMSQVMTALNIPQCALSTWNKILDKYNIDEIISDINDYALTISKLTSIPDIGVEKTISIYNFFQNSANLVLYSKLVSLIKITGKADTMQGLTVYLSGKFEHPKSEIKNANKIDGIEFVNSITNSLDILVFADVEGAKAKKIKEQQLSGKYKKLKIMTIIDFNKFTKQLRGET